MRHLQVKIQNRKTGFTGSQKPVFRFWKNSGLPGFSVSVKTGLETLSLTKQLLETVTYLTAELYNLCDVFTNCSVLFSVVFK